MRDTGTADEGAGAIMASLLPSSVSSSAARLPFPLPDVVMSAIRLAGRNSEMWAFERVGEAAVLGVRFLEWRVVPRGPRWVPVSVEAADSGLKVGIIEVK